MSAVAITGAGAISAVGVGTRALASALDGDKRGIGVVERFATNELTTHLGAIVPGYETRSDRGLCVEYALLAAHEAFERAKLRARAFSDPRRVALVLGSSLGSGRARLFELTDEIADALGIEGPRLTVSTACTSSANAVGLARDLLASGAADFVLAGGSDVLTPELFAGFHALGVLGKEACAPFGLPTGTTLGEGAGFFVLERTDDARARDVEILAWVLGYGLSCDAYHPTSPDPSGAGISRAITLALSDAQLAASDVGYVNAHGTGTDANDAAEVKGIGAALGAITRLPISASKSFLGHAQGAAGILELLVTFEGLRAQRLPPTINSTTPRRGAPPDPVATPRTASFDVALSVNAAFAGANSAVVLGRDPRDVTARTPRATHLVVAGAGAVAGDVAGLGDALANGTRSPRRVGACSLDALLPMADPRGVDPSTRYVSAACALALRDAGVAVKGELRDRVGIVAAATTYSAESAAEFHRSVSDRGLARLNAPSFAKLVLNAPTGAAARLLSLRGPTSTITSGRGGGLVAIAYAAMLLSASDPERVAHLVATAFDELAPDVDTTSDGAEGAGALVLGRAESMQDATKTRLVSWAIGVRDERGLASTVERALGSYGARDVDVVLAASPHANGALHGALDWTRAWGDAPSAGGALACVVANDWIRTGCARRVLVASAGGGASAALLFEGGHLGS